MHATCVGDVEVISIVNDKQIKVTIENALCIPGLRVNLLSVPTTEQAGFTVVCSNGIILIKKNKIVYAQGKRLGNLYKLVFKLPDKTEYANLAIKTDK